MGQNTLSKPKYKSIDRMLVKIHKTQDGRNLVAMCDSGLIGKKFEEGKLQLDLSSSFYKGEEKSDDEIKELLKDAYMVNVVGELSVGFCLKLNLIEESHVIKIDGIPHAQAILTEQ